MSNLMIVGLVIAIIATMAVATWAGALAVEHGFPIPEDRSRLGCIDGLRGYLALAVMAYHFILWFQLTRLGLAWQRPTIGLLEGLGPGSVGLFFMITGCLFQPLIAAGFARADWRHFYIARAARILPLQVASIAVVGLVILVRLQFHPLAPGGETALSALRWATCCDQPPLFGDWRSGEVNAGVLWSLRIEWAFYLLVVPLGALAITICSLVKMPSVVVPIGLCTAGLVIAPGAPQDSILAYLHYFGAGMLACEISRTAWGKTLREGRAATFILLAALAIGHVVGVALPMVRFACHALFFVGIACGNSLFGLLRRKGAIALGEASFGIYLLHGIALFIVFSGGLPRLPALPTPISFATLPLIALVVVPTALLTYLAIERPMIRLGRKINRRSVLTNTEAMLPAR